MGFEPQGQKAHCKLVNFSWWFPAPRGERPQLSSSPDTAACVVCPWAAQGRFRDVSSTLQVAQSLKFAVTADGAEMPNQCKESMGLNQEH